MNLWEWLVNFGMFAQILVAFKAAGTGAQLPEFFITYQRNKFGVTVRKA